MRNRRREGENKNANVTKCAACAPILKSEGEREMETTTLSGYVKRVNRMAGNKQWREMKGKRKRFQQQPDARSHLEYEYVIDIRSISRTKTGKGRR